MEQDRIGMDEMAELIAEKLSSRGGACGFSPAEQEGIRDLLRTKRSAVRAFLWICGAVTLWVLKDAYVYLVGHLTFK